VKYTAIVLAAGTSTRMGNNKNKMFLKIAGIPLIKHTLKIFEKDLDCQRILLAIREEKIADFQKIFDIEKKIEFIFGGIERQDSVQNAVRALREDEDYVLIHDGARAFLEQKELEQVKKAFDTHNVALLGVPVKDTIKKVDDKDYVDSTLLRQNLWQAQTPQAFRKDILTNVHNKALQNNFVGTDDVSLVEKFLPDEIIKMIMGSYENIKITTSIDILLGEIILKSRKEIRLFSKNED